MEEQTDSVRLSVQVDTPNKHQYFLELITLL